MLRREPVRQQVPGRALQQVPVQEPVQEQVQEQVRYRFTMDTLGKLTVLA